MSFYIDVTYINLLSTQLRNFKKKKEDLYNCSCPFCGDSQTDKKKARGYFFRQGDMMLFKCHNCSVSTTVGNVLKFLNQPLYDEYTFHKYKDDNFGTVQPMQILKQPKIITNAEIKERISKIDLPNIKSLPDNHYAKQYVVSRMIPESAYERMFFTEDFGAWSGKCINEKYATSANDHRLVLPFFDRIGNLVGAQGRSFSGDKKLRYVTAKREDERHITFGLEKWNKFKETYIVEGPIDSLFITNALAVATSDLMSIEERIDYLIKDKTIFVFDNEPFSKEIGKLMMQVIANDYPICIWPKTIQEKDINDMVLSGLTPEQVLSIIKDSTKRGLSAQLEFNYWKKH